MAIQACPPWLTSILVAGALALGAAPAFAQGNDASTASSGGSQRGGSQGVVSVGAGAMTGDTSTGSSGPQPAPSTTPSPEPLPASFPITPPSDPFWGPRQLPINTEPARRCELIADANARRHCEARGQNRGAKP